MLDAFFAHQPGRNQTAANEYQWLRCSGAYRRPMLSRARANNGTGGTPSTMQSGRMKIGRRRTFLQELWVGDNGELVVSAALPQRSDRVDDAVEARLVDRQLALLEQGDLCIVDIAKLMGLSPTNPLVATRLGAPGSNSD